MDKKADRSRGRGADIVEVDDFDRKLIFELDKNCRVASSDLARSLGKSRQAIEYRIKRLQDEEVIRDFHTVFNVRKMGFNLYKMQLKLRRIGVEIEALRDFLKESGIVYWIGESSGSWDLLFTVFCRQYRELVELLNGLSRRFANIIVDVAGHMIFEIHQFPKNYLTGSFGGSVIHTSGETEESSIRSAEYRILAELTQDGRISIAELARRSGLTPSFVSRRLKALEESGVIVQYRVGLHHERLNLILFKAIIQVRGFTNRDQADLFSFISRLPSVQFYVRNLFSVELEILAESFEEYSSLMDEIRREFPRFVGDYDTLLLKTDEWTSAFNDYLRAQ